LLIVEIGKPYEGIIVVQSTVGISQSGVGNMIKAIAHGNGHVRGKEP
jgi:hypothetical protein